MRKLKISKLEILVERKFGFFFVFFRSCSPSMLNRLKLKLRKLCEELSSNPFKSPLSALGSKRNIRKIILDVEHGFR